MRQFAISDIHGCAKTFQALLEQIKLQPEDELYLLGDFINRGPDSKGVIDHIWKLQEAGFQLFCLRGNHEQMLLSAIAHPSPYDPPFPEFMRSFGIKKEEELPQAYVDWLLALPYYYEIGKFIFVHAGLSFDGMLPLEDLDPMLWTRDWYAELDRKWLGQRMIIHGHTPTHRTEILFQSKALAELPILCIDAGCSHIHRLGMGHLCAVNLGTKELFFQENIDMGTFSSYAS